MSMIILQCVVAIAMFLTLLTLFHAFKRRVGGYYYARIIFLHWTGVMALYFVLLAGAAAIFEVYAWLFTGEFYNTTFHYVHNCWVWENRWCSRENTFNNAEFVGGAKLIRGFMNWHAIPVFYVWGNLFAAYHYLCFFKEDRLELTECFPILPKSPTQASESER